MLWFVAIYCATQNYKCLIINTLLRYINTTKNNP
nr:MAG TPA: hypothetical protein [Bacteriophage sp.]